MATVGQRPQQFNPIQRYKDNTDDIEAAAQAAASRYRRRSISGDTLFTDQLDAKSVPPMPSRLEGGGGGKD